MYITLVVSFVIALVMSFVTTLAITLLMTCRDFCLTLVMMFMPRAGDIRSFTSSY